MAVIRQFSATTILSAIPEIAGSVGSHLAAKLQQFGSDERTLTDELCDMMCIWAELSNTHPIIARASGLPPLPIRIDVTKVSQREEFRTGADLELRLSTTAGFKRVSAQAKVLDPDSKLLRSDSPSGWRQLRKQLLKCRLRSGALAFLLVYVPHSELTTERFAFHTWEQETSTAVKGGRVSQFGASFIAVDDLIDSNGRWKTRAKLTYLGGGAFSVPSISGARLLLELLSCSRGSWIAQGDASYVVETAPTAFRELRLGVAGLQGLSWTVIQRVLSDYVRAFPSEGGAPIY
jgi:hypothetical protein